MTTKQLAQCLYCHERKELYARGICTSCYQKWRRAMKMIPAHRHAEAEQKLISEGKLLPADAGPKPESNPFVQDLAEFLLTDSERAALAQLMAGQSNRPEPMAGKQGRGRPKRSGSGPLNR